jgi:hypothetical protein
MPANPRRYFLCTGQCVDYNDLYKHPESHIIGHLRYVSDEGRKVTALARWEVSTSAADVPPLVPIIDVDIIGDARNIRCRHKGCSHTQKWEIGKAAFEQLMKRYQQETTT